jgi:hypothetical protein
VSPDSWRLCFAVLVDGEAVGMQDLTGRNFTRFGTVSSFSWLAPGRRGDARPLDGLFQGGGVAHQLLGPAIGLREVHPDTQRDEDRLQGQRQARHAHAHAVAPGPW